VKRVVVLSVLFLLMATTLIGGPAHGASLPPVIKIGAMAPMSGPGAASGQDMKEGYELALAEINGKGGILGSRVELVLEDDKNDPATAMAAFEKLMSRDKVTVVMGSVSSTVAAALAGPAKRYQPIMAWTGAASEQVEKAFAGCDWFFHYHPWEYHNLAATVQFFVYTGGKTVAIAYEDSLFGQSCKDGIIPLIEQAGLKVVAIEPFKTGAPDVTPMLTKIKAKNPDIFYWVGYGADAIPITTQAKEVNFNPKVTYGVPPTWAEGYGGLKESEYIAGLTFWTPDMPMPESREWVARYVEKFKHRPMSYWAPLAYTNLITVADAIEKAGTLEKKAVIDALAQTNYKSPLGRTLTFKPSKHIKHQGFSDWISFQWRGGKMEVVFPEDMRTKPLVYPTPEWSKR